MIKFISKPVLLIVISLIFIPKHSSAQAMQPKGITVSPAFQQVVLSAGEAQKNVHFSITNNKPQEQSLKITFSDFNTLNETGGLFFVGSSPTDLQKKYGLTKWISITPSVVTVRPGQTLSMDAVVQNLPSLSSGGHYGSLNITDANPELESASNNVALHPVASTLIFLTKSGGDTHKLNLQSVSYSKNFFKLPNSVSLRFHNSGNTHLIPRGSVTITAPSGKVIKRGIINEESGLILPETYRRFGVPLYDTSGKSLSGNYTLTVSYRFDGYDKFRVYQKTINILSLYVVPIVAVIVLIVLCFIFRKQLIGVMRKLNKTLRHK